MQSDIIVSVASKLRHAPMFQKMRLEYPDFHFNSRWIVTSELGSEANRTVSHWMGEMEMEICNSHALLVYVEHGEELKTGLVGVGIAYRQRVPIFVVGEHRSYSEWQFHRELVTRAPNMKKAIEAIRVRFRGAKQKMGRGNFQVKKDGE